MNSATLRKGLLIDASRKLKFTFDGREYEGVAGDTIASALAANGEWILSRSFKYHRPRGILTMAAQDANTLVQIGNEVSVFADRHPISDGLAVRAQNVGNSARRDSGFVMNRLSRFMPVGFYYRTFYKPKGIWEKVWEPIIRAKAGLGKLDVTKPTQGYYDKAYGWYDVVVVGAGPAGMAAAIAAADAGASVLLVDENQRIGGALNYARLATERDLVSEVKGHSKIEIWTDAICNAWYADNWLPVIRGNRLYKVRAKQVILATGLIEQPSQFRNNDLPGIMQGSAAQRLIRLFGVKPGNRAVILAANDDAYGVALDLLEAGVDLAAICDLRKAGHHGPLRSEITQRKVSILDGWCLHEAQPEKGHSHVRGVELAEIDAEGTAGRRRRRINCDLVCMSVGYVPAYQLPLQAGGKLAYDDVAAQFTIDGQGKGVLLAGSVDGFFDLDGCIAHGTGQGWTAAINCGYQSKRRPALPVRDRGSPNHPCPIFPHPKGMDFVDFDEDLQVKDIKNAIADGYRELELVKRFSTVGMGPSQGRHAALAAAMLVSKYTNRTISEVGVTTTRPPVTTEKIATLAGRKFTPFRQTPMHEQHTAQGAAWLLAGNWLRPAYYGHERDAKRLIAEEVVNARNNVGMIDVSTLGGLDVRGPDAAEFLNRMYTFAYVKLPVGKTRYLLMTNEAGTVVDDGVACRRGENYFYVTATTTGVDRIYRNMLWWNTQWRLDVDIANVTAAYAGVNLAGPNARKVLARLNHDIALSPQDFPYLAYREGTVAGIPARVFRVGFIGELGYEIHVPSRFASELWRAIGDAGKEFGIRPFGLEAQRLMRLEKGHVIIGQDTDGMTTPEELDMSWAVANSKPFFIGKRSLEIRNKTLSSRKLVGFVLDRMPTAGLQESNLVVKNGSIAGFITSIAFSPTLGRVIGLAYADRLDADLGSRIVLRASDGSEHHARVASPHFYDPENLRQEM
ncbi:2Fe-2S iron-sulfur cluster-binding protein [Mesorhizobium amorphae]|uniref:Putative sarcosine oxidase subunit alpha n=1 Tax=Mesorhizobium amorphae CCNWGS0123 TaxID=1082933 RepID=G6YK73_9HYPH|nr:2Fe-2S iron-sulfur cluster-binding protein [Mesorhizobium amorphae]ANT54866.1 aminomethyltransferase [Mesorhizobium amorphae CCNWGS0123]EHH03997.1 putative sarcosine oxidase subunit alpha [Mesorhizobium amorphae CCNWGS0123]